MKNIILILIALPLLLIISGCAIQKNGGTNGWTPPPENCVQRPGAECCLGNECVAESPDCEVGRIAKFYGCDENCMPDWGPCEEIEGKNCETANDCKILYGCVCGCWNKDYEPESTEPPDAECLCAEIEECKCENNVCTEILATMEEWQWCPTLSYWGCSHITSGAEPDENEPKVCGCIPDCNIGSWISSRRGEGTWPDGSLRGIFTCTSGDPPP